jgi:hypothetical protein
MLKYAYYIITEEFTLETTVVIETAFHYLRREPIYVRRQPRLTIQKFSKKVQRH